jgi:hypothetical protein
MVKLGMAVTTMRFLTSIGVIQRLPKIVKRARLLLEGRKAISRLTGYLGQDIYAS